MAKYRVYWTETVSCFVYVEEDSTEQAEKKIRHECQGERVQYELSRSKPMVNADSFRAYFVSDEE